MTYIRPQHCSWCDKRNTKIKEPDRPTYVDLNITGSGPMEVYDDTWVCRHCYKSNKLVKEYTSVQYRERR